MFSELREEKPPMPRKIQDACEIEVNENNIDKAWGILQRRTQQASIHKINKMRRWHPTTKSRRRAKRIRAFKRAVRINNLKVKLENEE